MSEIKRKAAPERPQIHVSETDYDIIADLALRIERSNPDVSKMLLGEIDRARVHPEGSLPKNVVALGSEVEFLDEATGLQRRVQLVFPADADIENGRVSIVTPVGARLI